MIPLALSLLLTTAPQSQPTDTSGATRLEACVDRETGDGRDGTACIGLISGPCQDLPGGSSTVGMVDCLRREGDDWRTLLERAMATTGAHPDLEPAAKRALIRSQADWRRGVERSLAVYDGRDGTFWRVARAGMDTDWTARRYLWVRGLSAPF